jgi:hypothetical protein
VYSPEETVGISGRMLDDTCEPVEGAEVAIQVSNSSETVYIAQVQTNASGFYTTAFILPPYASLGLYDVFAAHDGLGNTTSFTVAMPEEDSDGDGVPDDEDACPSVEGYDCNGCPDPCDGCAEMLCDSGPPTCIADDSECPATICPADECGAGGCLQTQMADYPVSVPNTCGLEGNLGICSQNSCTADCVESELCQPHADHIVFSEVMYDPPAPELSDGKEWLEIYNPTSSNVEIGGLTIEDNMGSWQIPDGYFIGPGGYATIARDRDAFFSMYGCYPIVDGFDRDLSNTGDSLTLKDGGAEIDMVAWEGEVEGWDIFADENKTISRMPPWLDTDTSADWLSNAEASPNPCLKMRQFSMALKKGWNLISIPVGPENNTIESVLSSIGGKYTMLRSFDPVEGWKTYDPLHPEPEYSDLHLIYPDEGYWINMTGDANLTVTGMEMANTQILLAAGWNLIGYPTFTVQGVAGALSSIDGSYELVRTYDTEAGWMTYDPMHPEFSDLMQMAPGFGYWVKMMFPDMVVI